MTLDEAIKRAEKVAEDEERNAGWFYDKERSCYKKKCVKCAEEHRQLVEWLKELKQLREQPKWIPVSEKLPEEGKEVLTCSNGGFIEIQSFEDSCADIYWENQNGDWTDIDEVIAWMPLPKPYESQERSGEE